jgi:putative membrane protein
LPTGWAGIVPEVSVVVQEALVKIRTLVPAVVGLAALGAPAAAYAAPAPAAVHREATPAQARAADVAWMKAAAVYDMAEIAGGKLAVKKASTNGVAALGAMFVKDHTAHLATLKKLAAARNVALPTTIPAPMAKAMATLVAAPAGLTWDRNWTRGQLSGHRTVLIATGKARQVSRDAGVLAFERKTLPVVRMHHTELAAVYLVIAPPATVKVTTG